MSRLKQEEFTFSQETGKPAGALTTTLQHGSFILEQKEEKPNT